VGIQGQPASHGNSKNHRTMGSSVLHREWFKVLPGKKMPRNMESASYRAKCEGLKVDSEKGIVVLNGCVAGPKGCIVKIQDAIKSHGSHPAAVEEVKKQ